MKNNNLFQNKKNLVFIVFAIIFGLILGIFTKVYLVKALDIGSGNQVDVKGDLNLDTTNGPYNIIGIGTPSADNDATTWGYTKQAVNGEDPGNTGVVGLWLKNSGDIYTNSSLVTGSVGIGTTDPSGFKLKVASNGSNNVRFGDGLMIGDLLAVSGSATINQGATINGGATISSDVTINNGDITINNGDVEADAFFYTSDKRLKKDIQPLNGSLNKITDLQGVAFNWKDQNKTDKEQIGLIAQEVEKVYPELVSTDEEGMKSLQYANLVAPLIESVKELKKINEKQEREIQAIQKKLEQSLK